MVTKKAWGAAIQNREEKFELKRRAVLRSAALIIRRMGYDALSLADIAIDLNVAKPTIYYYFRNKDEIVRELMEIAVSAFLDRSDHPEDFPDQAGATGAELLECFIRRSVRVTSDELGACLFAVYPSQLPPALRTDLDTMGRPIIQLADRVIRQGLDDGSLGPCDPLLVYHFVVNGLRAVPLVLELGHATREQVASDIVALVTTGLKPRK